MPDLLPQLTGPARKPASGGAPKQLVVLLHGLGADGNDLIGLAPYWAPLLPDAEFLSPDAPFPCDMAPLRAAMVQLAEPHARDVHWPACAPRRRSSMPSSTTALAARGSRQTQLALVGLLAGHDDVALCRACAARSRAGGDLGLFRRAGRADSCWPRKCARGRRCCWSMATPIRSCRSRSLAAAVAALERPASRSRRLLRPGLGHGIDEEGLRARRRVPARGISRALT